MEMIPTGLKTKDWERELTLIQGLSQLLCHYSFTISLDEKLSFLVLQLRNLRLEKLII